MIVVADESGQLGNRLFLFGHLIGFAEEYGIRIANLAFYPYSAYFQATDRDIFCRFPKSARPFHASLRLRRLLFRLAHAYTHRIGNHWLLSRWIRFIFLSWTQFIYLDNLRFLDLARNQKVLLIRGWRYRSYASFDKHAAVVRDYFRPLPEHENNIAALITACRSQADVIVGIHIRLGDYREFRGGLYYFPLEQYAVLMRRIQRMIPGQRVLFLLCSNEVLEAEEFEGLTITFATSHLVEDMYALAACDYIAGPPSTFSQWASFYGKVPLYRMTSADKSLPEDAPLDWEQFQVSSGNCDYPEELAQCQVVTLE